MNTFRSDLSDLQGYREKRESFYERFATRWPGALLDAYDLLEVYPIPRAEVAAITRASEAIARIYKRTAALLRTAPDEALLQMGLPQPTLELARSQTPGMPDVVIGRLDLLKTPGGYKLLEFNADVPGLMTEAFAVNAKVCEEAARVDPNRGGETALAAALRSAVLAGLDYVGVADGKHAQIVFTSCSGHVRDKDTTHYLMSLLDLPEHLHKHFVPIESLCGDSDGLYDPDRRRIEVLYRLYPIQFFCGGMFRDTRDGSASMHDGNLLFDLVQRRKLAVINPPSAFLCESKAVQVVIWGLYEAGLYFDEEERVLIGRHFLPSYLDPIFDDEQYVIKPVYGGEGDTVTIVDPKRGTVLGHSHRTYAEQPMVYQKYVEPPIAEVMTEDGPQRLRLLISCFLIAGHPIGICMRAGHAITDATWWVVPVCVAD